MHDEVGVMRLIVGYSRSIHILDHYCILSGGVSYLGGVFHLSGVPNLGSISTPYTKEEKGLPGHGRKGYGPRRKSSMKY
jgi:hypothetical protein